MKYEAQDEQRQAFYWQEYQSERTPDYVSYDQGQFSPTPSLDGAVIGAILSYSLGWFTGLIFYLFGRNHPYVRFHALQSLLFFGAINIADVALFNIIDALTRFHLFPFLSFRRFYWLGSRYDPGGQGKVLQVTTGWTFAGKVSRTTAKVVLFAGSLWYTITWA